MMKKAERLLDLIAFLLNKKEPVSFAEIQGAFPDDYLKGSDESIARKFERDKADILALGLPLKLLIGDEYEKEGYVIDRKSYGLPMLDLGPEELTLLFLAGTAALEMDSSPFQRDLVLALNKIAYASVAGSNTGVNPPRALPTAQGQGSLGTMRTQHLSMLRKAISQKKTITISYHALWKDEVTTRKVDPYGLVWLRGDWLLVGFCHLRDDIRVFHVDRISGLAVNPLKPKSPDFDIPEDFKLEDHVAARPWLIKNHEPVRAVIRFKHPVAQSVASELASLAAKIEKDGEDRLVHLDATWLDGLVPTVLWYRHRAQVIEPPQLVEKVTTALESLATGATHG